VYVEEKESEREINKYGEDVEKWKCKIKNEGEVV
jgi:hypothetical protein